MYEPLDRLKNQTWEEGFVQWSSVRWRYPIQSKNAKTWPISQSYTSLDIVSELQLLPSLPSTFPVGNRANSDFFLVVTIYALLIPVFQFTYQRLQIQKKRGGVHFHLHYQDCREHLWSDIYQYRVKISKMTREALYSTGSYKKKFTFRERCGKLDWMVWIINVVLDIE